MNLGLQSLSLKIMLKKRAMENAKEMYTLMFDF